MVYNDIYRQNYKNKKGSSKVIFSNMTDWHWDYRNQQLYLYLTDNNRKPYLFATYYSLDQADQSQALQPFSIMDAQLLSVYQDSLGSLVCLNDNGIKELALNAVACRHFVRNARRIDHFFLQNQQSWSYQDGDIVTLYGKTDGIADCIILKIQEDLAYLMLLNAHIRLDGEYDYKIGEMFGVAPSVLFSSRLLRRKEETLYA